MPIFYDILKQVDTLLRTAKNNADVNTYTPKEVTFKGSISVVPHQDRVQEDPAGGRAGINLIPISQRQMVTKSYASLGTHVVSASTIFKYRIRRYNNTADCMCYTYQNGNAVAGWAATADVIYNSLPRWNFPDFVGPMSIGNRIADDYVNKIRKIQHLDAH